MWLCKRSNPWVLRALTGIPSTGATEAKLSLYNPRMIAVSKAPPKSSSLMKTCRVGLFSSLFLTLTLLPITDSHAEQIANTEVRIQLMHGQQAITFTVGDKATLRASKTQTKLPAGKYSIRPGKTRPARRVFHLFAKTFRPGQQREEKEYLRQWRAKGYKPEIVEIGKRLKTRSGDVLDNRIRWVSITRLATEAEAEALKDRLDGNGQPVWMHPETLAPGKGRLNVTDARGRSVASVDAPVRLDSRGAIEVSNVDIGFWKEQKTRRAYSGRLIIEVGPEGLDLVEALSLDDYVKGVLPAEMPAVWPVEALKAQAVAARTDVVGKLGDRHSLEGFDFCGTEHCRAYKGHGGRHPSTDEAARATAGQILISNNRVISTVFSSNCGGATENNDSVWSGPPNAALRGVSDVPGGASPRSRGAAGWLLRPPKAYCSGDKEYFRWRRTFSAQEVTRLLDSRYGTGRVTDIMLGERGVSGRLKSIRVIGAKKTVTIGKELAIRRAFDGLPSALFMLDVDRGSSGPRSYTLIGGGRGHGVGLCQHGARGMAAAGIAYTDIINHYYSGARLARY